MRIIVLLLGNLSNDYGDGNENVISNMNSAFYSCVLSYLAYE